MTRWQKSVATLVALMFGAVACTNTTSDNGSNGGQNGDASPTLDGSSLPMGEARDFGEPPTVPTGDLSPEVQAALDVLFDQIAAAGALNGETQAMETIAESEDPRLAWLLADLLRFTEGSDLGNLATVASRLLLGIDLVPGRSWGDVTDHLIAWDIPAPPGYLEYKRTVFTFVGPEWERLFEEGSDVDWRHVSWGGVRIDDRPFGQTDVPCNCIPAADDPEVTDVEGGDWYPDDGIVFGVEINGEARAYPRNIMEIREMVNDTLGGRDIGMPYCTLCGSAQVYFTDDLPEGVERPVLRTSGLLIRSNKVMYDVNTFSVFDTFLGTAVTGPLAEQGFVLPQHTVVTTTWGEWKSEHPDTTILDESLTNGRDSDLRNTRDANGPIFPIGDVDPRLPVQEDVVGVITGSGTPVAFHVDTARATLEDGGEVRYDDIEIVLAGGGLRAIDGDGNDVGGHQAFWFAWSQFHPDTELWPS